MADATRVRRNIDDVPKDEFENYLHALRRLHEIADQDPESIDGYIYFEQLHDGDKGPCEHFNDTFLPWHRAHLYLFEEALRRSDPPRTSNVAVPYWDWSAVPSGSRYPKRFEDESSSLFRPGRNTPPICRNGTGSSCARLPFPRQYLETKVLTKQNWSVPLPLDPNAEVPDLSFGGVAGGESDCSSAFGFGPGRIEQPAHNLMHGAYIGGDMADPSAAALDPIFWSFHAYIDLLWLQWQRMPGHEVNTGLDSRLCGLFKDREHQSDQRFRVRDVINPETQLQYVYEFVRREAPPMPEPAGGRLFPTHPAIDFVLSGRTTPEMVRALDVTLPQPGFSSARLLLTGVQASNPFTYGADIYLTPQDEPFRPDDWDFRARYLVDLLVMWKAHHHHGVSGHGGHGGHGGSALTRNLAIDVAPALEALAATHHGQNWRIWVALAADRESPASRAFVEAAAPDTLVTKLDFRDLLLRVT